MPTLQPHPASYMPSQCRPVPFLLLILLIAILPATDLFAQRITYEYLRMRDRQPNVFFEHLILPDTSASSMDLVTTFRIENNFLSFRRVRDAASGDQARRYFSDPNVQLSIQKITGSQSGVDPLQTPRVQTRTWNQTIYAETYEQTQSSTLFVEDAIITPLEPGRYRIESSARSDSRSRRSRATLLQIPERDNAETAFLYYLDETSQISAPFSSPLMNMGNNVFFGRDFHVVAWIPTVHDGASYSVDVAKLRVTRQDTSRVEQVFEYHLDRDNFLTGYYPAVSMSDGKPHFHLEASDKNSVSGAFYLITIPNSRFENAHYRMNLSRVDNQNQSLTLASKTYQSLWLDMPVSLLNLDVAIDMMRFILDDSRLRALRRGDRQQRERQFRDFWAQRDPTPEREYNELMVEYFRRIDYAFEHFTTPQNPGYESDQGKVYIRNGEPDRRERTFPPNQPAREVWHYDGQIFLFEATSGFGDFKLVDQQ